MKTVRAPFTALAGPPSMMLNSAGRVRSNDAVPFSQNRSSLSVLAWPNATRDSAKVPTAPLP
jgi:hypothetical protein